MSALHFVVYSDYLCPWCYNASVRLERLQREFGDAVELEWRSFLLRPRPEPGRDFTKFVRYTRSWSRPAAEQDAGQFRVWESEAGPPSHSVPPHLAAKAAAELSDESFRALHTRLLRAYFAENRDVTRDETLRALWRDVGLPDAEFERVHDPALLRRVLGEHEEALERGITGVPAVRLEGNDAFIVGAQPFELYQRWVRRHLPGGGAVAR